MSKNYDWGNWGNWGTWGNSSFTIDTLEEKLARKKHIKTELTNLKTDKGIIAKTFIGGSLSVTRSKGIFNITVPNTQDYKDDVNYIGDRIDIYNKIPNTNFVNSYKAFVNELVSNYHKGDLQRLFARSDLDEDVIIDLTNKTQNLLNKQFITEDEFKEIIASIPPKEIEVMVGKGHGDFGIEPPYKVLMQRSGGKINITPKPNKAIKRASLMRGRRINRDYIIHTDYKALQEKVIEKNIKKKLFILIDGSGSMGQENSEGIEWFTEAVSFASNLINTDIFDVKVILTESSGVTDVTKKLTTKETEFEFYETGGGEGFGSLTARLGDLNRDEDFVIILTDMCVPQNAEDNLKLLIGAKKHLVLSFGEKKKFQNLNVRFIKNQKDILNVVNTLLN